MKPTAALALATMVMLGCPGPKGDTGVAGHTPLVFDANSLERGTLVGTSLTWTHNTSGLEVPGGGLIISYRDANGVIWSVGMGGGGYQLPNAPLFFASAGCSGPVLLRNASPFVPVAMVVGTAPLKGVYQATTATSATPLSWINPGDMGACSDVVPVFSPPTFFRNANRLGDFPMTPVPAPLTIGP